MTQAAPTIAESSCECREPTAFRLGARCAVHTAERDRDLLRIAGYAPCSAGCGVVTASEGTRKGDARDGRCAECYWAGRRAIW